MTRLKAFIPMALALGALQVPARAATPDSETPARAVDYSDLNLAKNADAARLYGRIRLAATSVCGPWAGKDAQRAARFHHCVDDAVTQAVAQVGILSPLVSRLNP